MTWKFIYTYRERWKTGPAYNRCWNWSPFTSKHTWMRFSKFWNTFPKVSTLTAWISWRIVSFCCSIVRGVFLYTLPFSRPKERSRQALDRLPIVSNFLTNFWIEHFDGARLSPNSVRNAVWHTLNELVCQYLRIRNPRCSTVYIDNSLGPLATESPVVYAIFVRIVYMYSASHGLLRLTFLWPDTCNHFYEICLRHMTFYLPDQFATIY